MPPVFLPLLLLLSCSLMALLLRFALEPRWSETGDRYIIKLFRDYVFHQVDEHGNPLVNMSHVLTCLNKARRSRIACVVSIHPCSSWTLVQKKGSCWFPETILAVWSSLIRKLKRVWRVPLGRSQKHLVMFQNGHFSPPKVILRGRARHRKSIFSLLDE